jgi:hydrogenase expression/formation protein HypE
MTHTSYPLGKLPADHLAKLLATYQPQDPRLIVGGRVGEDAAVIEMDGRYLVAKTDPITFATDEIGWYAVNVNANDIACTGAIPQWFLVTILLPEGKATSALVDDIFAQIAAACANLNITLAGGHTEITYGLDRPIVVGHMLGEVSREQLVLTSGAQPGDDLLLTKRIAIEATAIMAHEKRAELQSLYCDAELDRLADFLHQPGISVVAEAQAAVATGGVHAMHDPTEGGIATGLWELAQAANVGLEIFEPRLPYHPDCQTLCQHFGLDPLGVIASGSLLLAIDSQFTQSLCEKLAGIGIDVSVIGQVKDKTFGLQIIGPEGSRWLPTFERDEITKLFE